MAGEPEALNSRLSINDRFHDPFTYLVIALSNGDCGRGDVEEKSISLWDSELCILDIYHWWRLMATADVNAWWVNIGGRVWLVDEVGEGLGVDNAFHFLFF